MVNVIYELSCNNSGGSWWLKDKDFAALEKAGWEVEWGGLYFCGAKYQTFGKPTKWTPKKPCGFKDCQGHRRYPSYREAIKAGEDCDWLGAKAKSAKKAFGSIRQAVDEFERITGQDFFAEGCNCCGAPFSMDGGEEYLSGNSVEREVIRPW